MWWKQRNGIKKSLRATRVIWFYDILLPVLNVGGSSPFGRTKEKSSESLDFKGFSGLLISLTGKFQMAKTTYF